MNGRESGAARCVNYLAGNHETVTMLEINNKERGVDYFIEHLAYFCSCGGSKAFPHPQPGVHLTCNRHVFWHGNYSSYNFGFPTRPTLPQSRRN